VVLAQQGEKYGSAGKFAEALEAFSAATAADPFDPHSHYLRGLTLLNLRRYAEAVVSYRTTEHLAPGWFHCRADLWLAEQLALGEVSHEVFLALHLLEDGQETPEEKVCLAEQVLANAPGLAPLHFLRGKSLVQLGRLPDARAAYRDGLACSPERDLKTRLLVELGMQLDDPQERIVLLREAQTLAGNLIASAAATLLLRTSYPT
jgi:tetratricopeptide (TPR) repeat protein